MAENSNVFATFALKGGKKYEVIECNYGFSRTYDSSNKPSGSSSIDLINLTIRVTEDVELVDWVAAKMAEKDGEVIIKLDESKLRKIKFKRGYCVNYNERFDNYSSQSFLVSMGILAKEITVESNGSVNLKAEWDN